MALDGDDTSSTIYIDDLNPANPAGDTPKSQGDDHLRFIKKVLKNTFPNITGQVTPTQTELNYVDGVTSQLSGNSQTATLENKTLTSPAINGGSLNNTITFNGEISASGVAISPAELGTLNGSDTGTTIQTQLNGKATAGADVAFEDLQINESAYFDAEGTITAGLNPTIDWSTGNKKYISLASASVSGSFAFTAPAGPTNLTLRVATSATYTIPTTAWPSTVKWPGAVKVATTSANSRTDIFNFYYDGTNYYVSYLQNVY